MVHGFHVKSIDIGHIKTRFQVTVLITFLKHHFEHTAFIAVYVKGGKCQILNLN